MVPHEDIYFQLVDLPAVHPEHPIPWLTSTLETADAGLLVLDLSDPACVEQVDAVQVVLREQRVTLTLRWKSGRESAGTATESEDDPFGLELPTLILANKVDRLADVDAELRTFLEVTGLAYPALAVSATTGQGLGNISPWLFNQLGIVRVYTKVPGRLPKRDRPFVLRRGQTVEDVARLVHKELARSFQYAPVWGKSGFNGHHVGREYELADGDTVELHA